MKVISKILELSEHARARAHALKQSSVSGGVPRASKTSTKFRRRRGRRRRRRKRRRRRRRSRRRGRGGGGGEHYAVAQTDLDSELYAVRTALGAFPGTPIRQIAQLRSHYGSFYQSSIINGEVFPFQADVTQRVGRGIALLFHDRGTRRG